MKPIDVIIMQASLAFALGALALHFWSDGILWMAALDAFACAVNLLALGGRIAIYPRTPGST
jgi:hypothetical protein